MDRSTEAEEATVEQLASLRPGDDQAQSAAQRSGASPAMRSRLAAAPVPPAAVYIDEVQERTDVPGTGSGDAGQFPAPAHTPSVHSVHSVTMKEALVQGGDEVDASLAAEQEAQAPAVAFPAPEAGAEAVGGGAFTPGITVVEQSPSSQMAQMTLKAGVPWGACCIGGGTCIVLLSPGG